MVCGFKYIKISFNLLRISLLDLYMQNGPSTMFRSGNVLPCMLREIWISLISRLCGTWDAVKLKKFGGIVKAKRLRTRRLLVFHWKLLWFFFVIKILTSPTDVSTINAHNLYNGFSKRLRKRMRLTFKIIIIIYIFSFLLERERDGMNGGKDRVDRGTEGQRRERGTEILK